VGLVLAAAAIAAAWIVFRLDREAQRQASVRDALARLVAVQKGMVEGEGELAGWGERYFSTVYDEDGAIKRARRTGELTSKKRAIDQVFVVPPEPLQSLAATVGSERGLISERTLVAANFALWRVHVFNQLVDQLSRFNARHVAEIKDKATTPTRRRVLARASVALSKMLHGEGIGRANAEGGWYRELKSAVSENVDTLHDQQRFSWPDGRLVLGDVAVTAILIVAIVAASSSAL
jgi:hypothetical protein